MPEPVEQVEPRTLRSDLSTFELVAGLDGATVKRLLGGLPAVRLPVGEELDIQARGAVCGLVRSGRLALDFDVNRETQHRTVTLLEEGDVLLSPSQSWISAAPRFRCRALQPSVVILVDEERFDAWVAEPRMAANMVHQLAGQVADRELAVAIALEPRVERRLFLKLRQLAYRFGRATPQGLRLDLRLTHQQLADMVGAVRESVTIAMGKLSASGELIVENRTIWIPYPRDESPEAPHV